jgi:ech hydrogenase subunit D
MDGTAFLARVEEYHKAGWRLALINATSLMPSDELAQGAFDVVWAFAKETEFEYLRERVMPGEEMPSISASFGASFLYENEIRELFGINVTGIALDLHGQLYKTSQKVPFSPSAIRARLEANAAAGIASASATPPVAGKHA